MARKYSSTSAPSVGSSLVGLPTREMSPAEVEQLLRRFRSATSRILRILGIVVGFGVLFIALTYFLGWVTYDPNSIPWVVMVAGIFSAGCTGAGTGIIGGARAALRTGRVLDQTGPLYASATSPPGFAEFQVGVMTLQVPKGLAGNFAAGQTQRLCVAVGLRPMTNRKIRELFPDRGLLISANGVPLPRPIAVFWKVAPAAPGWYGASANAPAGPMAVPPLAFGSTPVASAPTAYCDRCGQLNAPDFQFCRVCGAPRSTLASR